MDTAPPETDAPARPAPRLDRRAKAAIVVRLLLAEGLSVPLGDLPEDLQADLAQAMAELRYVDRRTLQAVLSEFLGELESAGLAFPGGLQDALDTLGGALGDGAAARLRSRAGLDGSADPWARIEAAGAARLVPVMQEESAEVAAVVLSKLRTETAAALLGLLPGDRARLVTYTVSQIGAVSPRTVARIGAAVLDRIETDPPGAFATAADRRVGAILNASAAETREAMLAALGEEDAGFAEDVRRSIFTFADIPARLEPRDVPKITRELEGAVLVRALAAAGSRPAEQQAAEFLLSGLSQRMAAQIREDMAEAGTPAPAEGEAAMAEVTSAIRAMEERGEISLIRAAE